MKLIASLILTGLLGHTPIVIRHDKNDQAYQDLSKRFAESICQLNLSKTVPDGVGTVIDKNWILTAAHCAIDVRRKLEKGELHEVTIGGEFHKVDAVFIHENWAENEAYDIALLHLDKPSSAAPVDLYNGDGELHKIVYVVGMGDTGDGLKGISGNDGKLRAATNRVDESTDFWLKWRFDDPGKFPEKVTEFEGISGPGDSGGPAFMIEENKTCIVGISSAQSTRNTQGKEGVYGVLEYYTRVSRYSDWISSKLRNARNK